MYRVISDGSWTDDFNDDVRWLFFLILKFIDNKREN